MKGKNVFTHGMRGSAGAWTTTKAKDGDTIAKQKITQMTNPNTTGQQNTRSVFKDFSKHGSAILAFIRAYFTPSSVMRSAFNEYVSVNVASCMGDNCFERKQATNQQVYTKGPVYDLLAEEPATPSETDNGSSVTVNVAWPYDAGSQAQVATDVVRYLVTNTDNQNWSDGATASIREDDNADITIPYPSEGFNLLTVFAVDASTGEPSTSSPCLKVAPDKTVTWF